MGCCLKDVNTRRQIFLSLSKLGCSLQEFNSRKFHLHLTFKASWNNRDDVLGNANLFLTFSLPSSLLKLFNVTLACIAVCIASVLLPCELKKYPFCCCCFSAILITSTLAGILVTSQDNQEPFKLDQSMISSFLRLPYTFRGVAHLSDVARPV